MLILLVFSQFSAEGFPKSLAGFPKHEMFCSRLRPGAGCITSAARRPFIASA
jgi:hypothetical protein